MNYVEEWNKDDSWFYNAQSDPKKTLIAMFIPDKNSGPAFPYFYDIMLDWYLATKSTKS